jgi:hypothetical protein
MEEKHTFTNRDQLLGICHAFEVGMPYEERWSKADAFEGKCLSMHIGSAKASVVDPMAHPDTLLKPDMQGNISAIPVVPVPPMTRAERKVKLQSVVDKIIHYADAHPEAMLDDNGAQINKLMDLFSKMDDREEEAPALGKLSAADLQKMSISELKLLLVRVVMEYVPEDRREAALVAFRQG